MNRRKFLRGLSLAPIVAPFVPGLAKDVGSSLSIKEPVSRAGSVLAFDASGAAGMHPLTATAVQAMARERMVELYKLQEKIRKDIDDAFFISLDVYKK